MGHRSKAQAAVKNEPFAKDDDDVNISGQLQQRRRSSAHKTVNSTTAAGRCSRKGSIKESSIKNVTGDDESPVVANSDECSSPNSDGLKSSSSSGTAAVPSAATDFSLNDVVNWMCANLPPRLNVRDEQLSLALLDDVELGMLDDMINYFLMGEGVKADERPIHGPPKWSYSEDPYDNFDYYASRGCPNCGTKFELDFLHALCFSPPVLACRGCGHRPCPLHFDGESEAVVDRVAWADASSSGGATTSGMPSEAVYLRGDREGYFFGHLGKDWWKNQYLPHDVRVADLRRTLTMIGLMSRFKAPTINELCEVCGNDKAFYHTFQARSADEGMTIMYECTRCHARRTFNN
eukprot:Lankesteria_metandrocarpae@DN318_c0_g1_i1.p1